ncbi:RHS repeat-associated core domain-containing protein [Candidatus Peregrinibacteria bacterium]|nr:RHS repeat-associated core domain-containing protein [Candidatus Peregrinibacteria bacterium]
MSNDLVAQVVGTTAIEASIYPVAKNLYNWKDPRGLFLKLYAYARAFVDNPASARAVNMAMLILALLGAIGLLIYNVFFRQKRTILIPRWMAHSVPMLLIIFFASFGLTGCFESLFPNGVVNGVYYFHPNHNGSVKMITRSEGGAVSVVARYKYKPYGEMLIAGSSGAEVSKYKYTAQESDDTTGLYYYNARFYDPEVGRFITADSQIPNPLNSQDFNRYMYVNGNPVVFNDPSGHGLGSMIKHIVGKTRNAVSNVFKGNIVNTIKHTAHSLKDTFNNAKNWAKQNSNKIKDHFEGSLIGGLIGGPIGELIGGYLGKDWLVDKDKEFRDILENTVGSGDWWQKQWDSWAKVAVCVIVIVVLIVISIILWYTGFFAWGAAPLIGVLVGCAYGGTNGFKGGWNWEGAAVGAGVGFVIGCVVGAVGPSALEWYLTPSSNTLASAGVGGFTSVLMACASGEADNSKLALYFVVGAALGALSCYMPGGVNAGGLTSKGVQLLDSYVIGNIIESW